MLNWTYVSTHQLQMGLQLTIPVDAEKQMPADVQLFKWFSLVFWTHWYVRHLLKD